MQRVSGRVGIGLRIGSSHTCILWRKLIGASARNPATILSVPIHCHCLNTWYVEHPHRSVGIDCCCRRSRSPRRSPEHRRATRKACCRSQRRYRTTSGQLLIATIVATAMTRMWHPKLAGAVCSLHSELRLCFSNSGAGAPRPRTTYPCAQRRPLTRSGVSYHSEARHVRLSLYDTPVAQGRQPEAWQAICDTIFDVAPEAVGKLLNTVRRTE